jgi:hypothetical protein
MHAAPPPSWRILRIAAETFADFQQFRVAANNRAERGGVPPDEFADLVVGLDAQEAALRRVLVRAYRAAVSPAVRDWQQRTPGLGEPTFARLLGLLGHPRVAFPWHWEGEGHDRHLVADAPYARTISQLWSYCGVGDATRKQKKGKTADELMACGSPRLRSLLFLVATSCMKNRASPYRAVYEEQKAAAIERGWHEQKRRFPPTNRAEQHALRVVGKEVLRDLWLVAGDGANPQTESTQPTPLSSLREGNAAMTQTKSIGITPLAVLEASA